MQVKNKILLGSALSFNKNNQYFLGAVKTAIKNNATTLMVCLGPSQDRKRTPSSELFLDEGWKIAKNSQLKTDSFVTHASYMINLATHDDYKLDYAYNFLKEELYRLQDFKIKYIVLHPGSYVNQTKESGMANLIKNLKKILAETEHLDFVLCLETMSGKGFELGSNFEELNEIIQKCNHPKLAVCMDICHLHNSGYDLTKKDEVIKKFDEIIGLEKLKVIHVSDALYPRNCRKDRHANIGYGHIGFETLLSWIYDERFAHVPKLLETTFLRKKISKNKFTKFTYEAHKYEIDAILKKKKRPVFPKKYEPKFDILKKITSKTAEKS